MLKKYYSMSKGWCILMENKIVENLENLKKSVDVKSTKKLNLHLSERVIERLLSFMGECEECRAALEKLNNNIEHIIAEHGQLKKADFIVHKKLVSEVISHLTKKHKLVTEGYYMNIFLLIFLGAGYIFGQIIFDNISIGMSFGLSFGIIIGSILDSSAKKKGLVI